MRKLSVISFGWLLLSIVADAREKGIAHIESLIAKVPHMKEDSNGVKLLDYISSSYSGINSDEGLKWAEKELELSRKIGWRKGEGWAFNNFGNHWGRKSGYAKALEFYFISLHILEEEGADKYSVGAVSSNIGLLYYQLKEYEKSLYWNFKSLQIAREINDSELVQTVTGNIGIVYQLQGENEEALKYQLMSLDLAAALHDSSIGNHLLNIGGIYQNLKQYSKALDYTFRGLRISEEMGYEQNVAAALGNAGENYYFIAMDSTKPKPDSLVPVSRAANLVRAIEYLQRGIALCRDLDMLNGIVEFAPYLSNALAEQGDHHGALLAYKEYVAAKDSLFNAANTEHIASLETQRAVALKDKDIQIAKLEVTKKKNERFFFLTGIGLLLAIMGIIIYNFRRHVRSRKRIKELQDHKISVLDEAVRRRTEQLGSMRQTLATDFHDQTGNMLAAITRQACTLELKLLNQPEVLPMVRSIITNSNELYASSKDFLWNLNHDSDDPLVLFQYLSGYGQRFYNQFDISYSVIAKGDAQPHRQLQPFAGLNIIYIFKEAMSNVVKHSGADQVSIELHWETNKVVYALKDNGLWKEADPTTEHYGLTNMQRRCQQSGFDYNLLSTETGTRVEVIVPLSAKYISTISNSETEQLM